MAKGPFSSRHQHCTVPINHISSVHMHTVHFSIKIKVEEEGVVGSNCMQYSLLGRTGRARHFNHPEVLGTPWNFSDPDFSSTRTQHKDFSCSKGTHIKCECHISNVIQIWNKLRNDISWWQLSSDFWEHSNVHWKLAAGQLNIHLRSRQHLVKLRGEHRAFQI